MNNIFLACTQHHVCLSIALIKQKKLLNSKIIFFSSNSALDGDSFFKSLEFAKSPGLYEIEFVYPDKAEVLFGPFRRFFAYRKLYNNLLKCIGSTNEKHEIYIFNDARHESQFVITKYTQSNFYFVQDGLAQYVYHKLKVRKSYKMWYYKILFGFFWKSIEQHGDYYNYKTMYLMLPDLAHDRIKIPKKPILSKYFYNEILINASRDLIKKDFPEFFVLNQKSIIVFLPFIFNKKQKDEAKKQLDHLFLKDKAERVFIKNHPRGQYKLEYEKDVLGTKFVNIPDGIPAECFFALSNDNNVKYYLTPSTLLIIAEPICTSENVRVIFQDVYGFVDELIAKNVPFNSYFKEKFNY